MMKIIQITDLHLLPEGGRVFDSDPAERLAAAIADINRHHADAGLCVLTGDLAHDPEPGAYALLRRLVAGLAMPVRLVPGNHDDRATLRAAFPEIGIDAGGFLQSYLDTDTGRLVFLDTVDPGVHSGAYCDARLAWLDDVLAGAEGRPAYLFMHHPPMPLAFPRLDQYRILDGEHLGDLLDRFDNVRHLFFGHVHRPISGSWRGIPFSTLRGTNHQNWFDLSIGRENISSLEPAAYAVIFVDGRTTIVHLHDYLDANPRFIYDPDAPAELQVRRFDG